MKQLVQMKNRIHALTRQNLLSYRKQNIFTKKIREEILAMDNIAFKTQTNFLYLSADNLITQLRQIKEFILLAGEKYSAEINLLTSIKGVSVFTALALVSDIADIRRFKNEKHLSSYLPMAHAAPWVPPPWTAQMPLRGSVNQALLGRRPAAGKKNVDNIANSVGYPFSKWQSEPTKLG